MNLSPLRSAALLVLALLALSCGMARADEFASNLADEFANVGRLHAAGETAIAIGRAERHLAANPKDATMRFQLGVMLADSRRTAQAIDVFTQLSQDHPDLPEPYNNLAALFASTGDYDKARSALELALRNQPGYAAAHENLGDIYIALAGRAYARVLELEPSNITVAPKLALVRQLSQGRTGTAIR